MTSDRRPRSRKTDPVRVIFRQHVRRGDVELVTGTVEIACVNMATMTPYCHPRIFCITNWKRLNERHPGSFHPPPDPQCQRRRPDRHGLLGRRLLHVLVLHLHEVVRGTQARTKTETFERDFWSGGDLNNLFNSAVNDRHHAGSMERIFEAGFREFTKLKGQKNLDPKDIVDGSRRAMRATYQREVDAPRSAPRFPRLGRLGFSPTSACSAPSGASCTPSAASPTSARQRFPPSRRALPKRWSPPPSASLRRFPPCSPTTVSLTTSTAWPPLRVVHGRVLQHPPAADALSHAPAPPQKRNQRRPLHRRHAGAARHLHGDDADDDDRQH
jgi:hypothetical protein